MKFYVTKITREPIAGLNNIVEDVLSIDNFVVHETVKVTHNTNEITHN